MSGCQIQIDRYRHRTVYIQMRLGFRNQSDMFQGCIKHTRPKRLVLSQSDMTLVHKVNNLQTILTLNQSGRCQSHIAGKKQRWPFLNQFDMIRSCRICMLQNFHIPNRSGTNLHRKGYSQLMLQCQSPSDTFQHRRVCKRWKTVSYHCSDMYLHRIEHNVAKSTCQSQFGKFHTRKQRSWQTMLPLTQFDMSQSRMKCIRSK